MSNRQNPALPIMGAAMAALWLSACSTVQENPNYQFSSKYEGADAPSDRMMMAESDPSAQSIAVERQDAQMQAPVVSASADQPAVSPTEEAYNADAMVGTPGYAILLAEEAQNEGAQNIAAPVQSAPVQPPTPSHAGPREVTYDYAQNVIVEGQPTPDYVSVPQAPKEIAPSSTPVTAPTARTYVVQPGDTIYSLSRRLCAPMADIMTANGIGADFAIDIGQTLSLPVSRC